MYMSCDSECAGDAGGATSDRKCHGHSIWVIFLSSAEKNDELYLALDRLAKLCRTLTAE